MRSANRKRKNKKTLTVLGIILGLAMLFYVSYKVSYGLFSSGNGNKNEVMQSTEEDIASMSRENLEKKYKELKKQLEEKEEEIKMLDERQKNIGDTAATPPPVTPQPATESGENDNTDSPRQTQTPSQKSAPKPAETSAPKATQTPAPALPAPTEAPKNLMTPEELANMAGASGQ